MIRKSLSLAFFSLFFSSCVSLAPNLDLSKNSVIPENFKNYEQATTEYQNSSFEFIKDEELKNIVAKVLKNNKDIKIALLRVEESKSLYRIEESNLYPKIDLGGSFF